MTIANKLALLEQTKEAQRVKLGLPKNIPFNQYVKFMRAWTPTDLFKNGEQGVWLDYSDLSTMFQDVNGTVPVTKDGDPVALIKDKSGNNNHATQATATRRPIYRTDGILHWLAFDGVDDTLKTANFGLQQPTAVVLALKTPVYINEFFDGIRGNSSSISSDSSGNTRLYAGAGGGYTPPKITLNKPMIFNALINKGASFLKIDGQPPATKDAGDMNAEGIRLMNLGGLYGTGSLYSVIVLSRALSENETQKVEAHVRIKAGLPL